MIAYSDIVIYNVCIIRSCSSKECQIADWPVHRKKCSIPVQLQASIRTVVNENPMTKSTITRIESTEDKKEFIKKENDMTVPPDGPVSTTTSIVVKCNHKRKKIDLVNVESRPGSEIMKQLAQQLRIPLDSLKVAGKGRLLHAENIRDMLIQKKCRIVQVNDKIFWITH